MRHTAEGTRCHAPYRCCLVINVHLYQIRWTLLLQLYAYCLEPGPHSKYSQSASLLKDNALYLSAYVIVHHVKGMLPLTAAHIAADEKFGISRAFIRAIGRIGRLGRMKSLELAVHL